MSSVCPRVRLCVSRVCPGSPRCLLLPFQRHRGEPSRSNETPSTGTVCSSKSSYTNLNRGTGHTREPDPIHYELKHFLWIRPPTNTGTCNELMMPIDSSNRKQGQITNLHSSTHDHGRYRTAPVRITDTGACQRVSESRGAPAVPHHFGRVGSRRTGCSNSHRFSSPAFPRLGCSLPQCHVSLLTRKKARRLTGGRGFGRFADLLPAFVHPRRKADDLSMSNSAPWMVKHSTPWMACPPPTFSSDRILEWRQPPTRAASRPQNCWGSSTDQHGTPTSPLGLVPYQRRSQPFAADAWVVRRRALRIEHMATGLASLKIKDARAGSVAQSFGRTSRGEFGFSSSSTLSGNSFDCLEDFTRHGASAPWKAGIPQKPRATAASSRSRF